MAGVVDRPFESRTTLRADCSRCAALCCVALSFRASDESAANKSAGVPCPHLVGERSCGIHDHLRSSGYRGCSAFDCFGAGQHVIQVIFAGQDWRNDSAVAAKVFAVFGDVRRLKELMWYLADAAGVVVEGRLSDDVREMRVTLEELVHAQSDELEQYDMVGIQERAVNLLEQVSRAHRDGVADRSGLELATGDLSGANFSRTNLRAADLRYTRLCNATLEGADLFGADLFGADLSDANVRGAHLEACLFLTSMQLEVTMGDHTTTIPSDLERPAHWHIDAGGR